ncbi:MAG: cytochrome c [Pyrinomonadaceae bacterium]|nr:cytochrome c [Pyrinomonadaceae bacterium]
MQKTRTLRLIITLLAPLVTLGLLSVVSAVDFSTTTPATIITTADGPALYASKCVICHGKNGAGTAALRAKGQPDLSTADWQKTHSDEQIAARIREGKGKMPGFAKKLSDEEIKALVKQVRTLRR